MLNPKPTRCTLKESLRVLSLAQKWLDPAVYEKIGTDPSVDFDIRVEGLQEAFVEDVDSVRRLLALIGKQVNFTEEKLIVGNLSVFLICLLLLFF